MRTKRNEQRAALVVEPPRPPVPLLSAFSAEVLRHYRAGKAVKTTEALVTTLAHLLRFAADVRLDEIDRALLERFRQERLEAGNSPKTVNYYLASVSAALTLAVNLGYLTTKPRLKKLKIKKPLPRFFIA